MVGRGDPSPSVMAKRSMQSSLITKSSLCTKSAPKMRWDFSLSASVKRSFYTKK